MHKSKTIYNWKKYGLICDDYNALYETYIKTIECQHCNKAFKKSSDRCLDHNHETGLFRKIVCRGCNVVDSYIKYPNGYTEQDRKEKMKEYQQTNKQKILEQNKEYNQKNKERISERAKQKIKCDCGSIVSRIHIARHMRSKKHSDYKLNNLV